MVYKQIRYVNGQISSVIDYRRGAVSAIPSFQKHWGKLLTYWNRVKPKKIFWKLLEFL